MFQLPVAPGYDSGIYQKFIQIVFIMNWNEHIDILRVKFIFYVFMSINMD